MRNLRHLKNLFSKLQNKSFCFLYIGHSVDILPFIKTKVFGLFNLEIIFTGSDNKRINIGHEVLYT